MKILKRTLGIILALAIPFACWVFAYAIETSGIGQGETAFKDQFFADMTVENHGTVKGDLFIAAQKAIHTGLVEGDLLCAAGDVDVSGKVLGDLRVAAGNATIQGEIGKNVNIFSGNTRIRQGSSVGGSLLAFGSGIAVEGVVKGAATIHAHTVVLSGEIFGDVEIRLEGEDPNEKRSGESWWRENFHTGAVDGFPQGQRGRLTLLPGTVIHGKLTYTGINPAVTGEGVELAQFEWIQPPVNEKNTKEQEFGFSLWEILQLAVSTGIYFLIAMLLYKVLPGVFIRQGEIVQSKPLHVFGIGLAALLGIFVFIIIGIFIVLLSIGLHSAQITIVFASVIGTAYILLFYLSAIPVAMWLGNLLFKERYNVPSRFGIGLIFFTVLLFLVKTFSKMAGIGLLFGIVHFLVAVSVLVMGMGAVLYGLGQIYRTIRRYEG